MAADPMINEFQAINATTIKDEDGDASDWIELRNPDTASINLDGWYLTDDIGQLNKWRLPEKTLAAGEHLLVFASGKNRSDAAKPLHTNFKLTGEGEYLALVKPDGRTVVQSFDPYPEQFENKSYGLAVDKKVSTLINADSPIKAFVPSDDSLGLNWTQPNFNDNGWLVGKQAVGYEVLKPGFNVSDPFDGPLDPAWKVTIPEGGQSTVAIVDGALQLTVPGNQTMTWAKRGVAPVVSRAVPGDEPADWEFITQIQQGTSDRGDAGIGIFEQETGRPLIQLDYTNRSSFRLISKDDTISVRNALNRNEYWLRLVRDSFARTWTAFFRSFEADSWIQVGVLTDGINAPVIDNPQIGLFARTPSSVMTAKFTQFQFNAFDQRALYGPLTGLDMTSTMRNKNASAYMRLPFKVSGDPARFDELDLSTRFDDGIRVYLNGTEIIAQNVPIVSTWNSSAAGEFGAAFGRIPTQVFDLKPYRNLLTTGDNLLAVQGMNVSADDNDFFFETSLTAREILGTSYQYFAVPTPGALNAAATAPPPKIVGTQGTFFGSTTVELVTDATNPQLAIFYTTNGTTPTTLSTRYTGPLVLNGTAMLQARTFDLSPNSQLEPSPITAGTFLAMSEDLRTRTSNLPIIVLDMLGQGLPGSGATTLASVNVAAFDVNPATGRASIAPERVDYLGRGGIRDRGSSTGGQTKPNLAFETWGPSGTTSADDQNVGLLGFAPDSDWVLHAPFDFDRALIRNQLAYGMANELGRWAPGTQPVEVYLNRNKDGVVTETDYVGVYILIEKIKMGKNRVDLVDVKPTDTAEPEISGGYMWKIDREDPGEPSFTAGGTGLNWVEPKSPANKTAPVEDKATIAQENWVKNYFAQFVATTSRNPNINDPNGYSKYIDVGAWVDHHLISVLGDNVDALNLSTYLHKDRGKKIAYGPQWDFDRSMESTDDRDNNPSLWGGSGGTAFFSSNYWTNLFRDPGFWQAYVDRWTELRRTTLSNASLNRMIDEQAAMVSEAQERNFKKWTGVRPRTTSAYSSGRLDGTWQGEVEHLRTWLLERAHFMDGNFVRPLQAYLGTQVVTTGGGMVVKPGDTFRLAGELRDVFDDKELIPTAVGAVTVRYFTPSDDTLGTEWTKSTFNDTSWPSGPMGLGFESPVVYGPLIATNVQPPEGGTTILARMEFQVDDPKAIDNLILRIRYDDGFVAYLNGQEILRRNVRDANLSWNSRANTRTNTASASFEDTSIQKYANLLVPGKNILAIRTINSTATNTDMLLQAALVNRKVLPGNYTVGKAYYTLDGSDPRGPDGQPAANALLYEPGQKIPVLGNTRLVARNFDNVIDRGPESKIVKTAWSAPAVYSFVTESPSLRVAEIHYHPATGGVEYSKADSEEFVEIVNEGSQPASLTGVRLAGNVEFDFVNGSIKSLQPGARAVVVANEVAFKARYGDQIPIAGVFSGYLPDQDGTVKLLDGAGGILAEIDYKAGGLWSLAADGLGASLELVAPSGSSAAVSGKWYHWTASQDPGGSPGKAGKGRSPIVINEVAARDGGSLKNDAIELINVSSQPVDISGWYLSDSSNNFFKFPIPNGTIVQPGKTVVFDDRKYNPSPANPSFPGFGLNGVQGDRVWLVVGDGKGGVKQFNDVVEFGGMRSGESFGRILNGSGRLAPQQTPSFGADNLAAREGVVILSEVNYNPLVSAKAQAAEPSIQSKDLEFIEIQNAGNLPIDLTGWRIRGGVDFDFPATTSINAGKYLVILPWNPANPDNALRVKALRAQYGIGEGVAMVGGYSGQLSDANDRITLVRPDIVTPGNPPEIAMVQEDEVVYDDLAPWPLAADGTGSTLQRKSATAFGNSGLSWNAGEATPGSGQSSVRGDFNGDAMVNAADINLLFNQLITGGSDLKYDLTSDGRVNTLDRDELVLKILASTYGDANLDRIFDSQDLVQTFQYGGYNDTIPRNSTWESGDWNGDGEFGTSDLVLAFQQGGYVESRVKPAVAITNSMVSAAAAIDVLDGSPNLSAETLTTLPPTGGYDVGPSCPVVLSESLVDSLFADQFEMATSRHADEATEAILNL